LFAAFSGLPDLDLVGLPDLDLAGLPDPDFAGLPDPDLAGLPEPDLDPLLFDPDLERDLLESESVLFSWLPRCFSSLLRPISSDKL